MLSWFVAHRAKLATENVAYLRLRMSLNAYWIYRTWLVNVSLPRVGDDDIARLDEVQERSVLGSGATSRELARAHHRWLLAYVRFWRRHRANPLFKPLDRLVRRALRAKA